MQFNIDITINIEPMLRLTTNQSGDIIVEILTIMDHSPTSITAKLAHTVLLRRMFKPRLIKNTNQNGDTTPETHITMVHSLTSTTVRLPHTQ